MFIPQINVFMNRGASQKRHLSVKGNDGLSEKWGNRTCERRDAILWLIGDSLPILMNVFIITAGTVSYNSFEIKLLI